MEKKLEYMMMQKNIRWVLTSGVTVAKQGCGSLQRKIKNQKLKSKRLANDKTVDRFKGEQDRGEKME